MNSTDDFKVDFSIDPVTGKERHDYLLNGKPLTGVTSILKVIGKGDFITQWAATLSAKKFSEEVQDWLNSGTGTEVFRDTLPEIYNQARYNWKEELAAAGTFGKHVHGAVEDFVKGDPVRYLTAKEDAAFQNFVTWATTNKIKFLKSEVSTYSKEFWYAGTIDLVFEDLDGKVWIGDVKTSSAIYPEHFFQTSAYQRALVERGFDRPIEGHLILNLKKDGRFDQKRSYGYERNFKAFLAALEIYRIKADLESELKK
jgi:hypothetical protein